MCHIYDRLTSKYNTFIDGRLVYQLDYELDRLIYGDFARIGQGGKKMESYSGDMSQVLYSIC